MSGGMVSNVRLQKALISARQYPEQSSHVTLRIKADYDDCQYDLNMINMDESMNYGEAVWGDAVWGWQDTVTKQVDLRAKAKRVNFFICDEHVDEPLLVYGLALVYKPRGVKGDKKGISRTAVSYD